MRLKFRERFTVRWRSDPLWSSETNSATKAQIGQVLQSSQGKILGYLIRFCGNFDDAEDICQDVMLTALIRWQETGLPQTPLAWLFTTAKNRATDRFRQQNKHRQVHHELALAYPEDSDLLEKSLEDDLLRLIFTCCHPALSPEVRVQLTLKSVAGFSLKEVARAFLVKPKTVEQRLLRARSKIHAAGIAYEVPIGRQLDARLVSVMQTLYLLFNEGYTATSGSRLIRNDLCREAIRLATLLQRLFPGRAELMSLLALMLIQNSRSDTRVSPTGDIVLLADQDRSSWNSREIQQGLALLDKALHLRQAPGIYQLQASIGALHAEAKTAVQTDWMQISLLYKSLLSLAYTEVFHLNYAVAVSISGNTAQALKELAAIEPQLQSYYPFYCARADCYQRLADRQACLNDYTHALTLTENQSERRFIQKQIARFSA